MTVRDAPAPPCGRGDGTITGDGCPVEIYAALPPSGEAGIVHAAVPPRAAVLELGCGTGRIADPLARLGHRVVGVDSSAAMLSHLRHAEGVCTSIEELNLAERFDAIVLAGHLVNTYDAGQCVAFLAAARRHLIDGGVLVLQRYRAGFRPETGLTWSAGDARLELRDVVDHGAGVFSATVVHRLGNMVAEQDFSARMVGDEALRVVLGSAGFHRMASLTADASWVLATAVSMRSGKGRPM
jgi:SAM-dependent methyltransferase